MRIDIFEVCVVTAVLWLSGYQSVPRIPAERVTAYIGGKSTPLQAIIGIATADKVPVGIVMGKSPKLCEREQTYNFVGMSTLQALQKASEGTNYTVSSERGVYQLKGADLTQREQEVLDYRFPQFSADRTTMKDLGARLTGYVSDLVEGTGSFVLNTLGSTDDEIIQIPTMKNISAPQIANEIVSLGSKGIWIMRAAHCDTGPKPGSTLFDVYSYHDSLESVGKLECPRAIECD